MKRVGILTFHRAHNYGAVLQTYALQEVVKSLGSDVKVINYKQPHIENLYAPFSFSRFCKLLIHLRAMLWYLRCTKLRAYKTKMFNNFISRWVAQSEPCDEKSIPSDIDTYIIGSDQLWGIQCTGNVIDPVYFGDFKRTSNSKVIGYAISSNSDSINKIGTKSMQKYAANFQSLSFREKSISNAIQEKSGVKSSVNIDPTLLAEASVWDPIVNDKWANERYVLIYQVRINKEYNKILIQKAEQLAKELKCKVINADGYSVEDFVSLFKYAQCVVTSSFHGTAFSLIFERPLIVAVLNDGHDGRCVNILTEIGGEQFLSDINKLELKHVDYAPIKSKIDKLRQESILYLKNNI